MPASYYVDAASGDDSKDGLSRLNAWKTIAKVNTESFSPGDYIRFRRGRVWNEQLNVPTSGAWENPIVYSVYGKGARPLIDATGNQYGILLDTKNHITMESLRVKSALDYGIYASGQWSNSDYLTLIDVESSDNALSGMHLRSNPVKLMGCKTLNNGYGSTTGPGNSSDKCGMVIVYHDPGDYGSIQVLDCESGFNKNVGLQFNMVRGSLTIVGGSYHHHSEGESDGITINAEDAAGEILIEGVHAYDNRKGTSPPGSQDGDGIHLHHDSVGADIRHCLFHGNGQGISAHNNAAGRYYLNVIGPDNDFGIAVNPDSPNVKTYHNISEPDLAKALTLFYALNT